MSQFNVSVGRICGYVLYVTVVLIASGTKASEPEQTSTQAMLNELKTTLESGESIHRETPFRLRPFEPLLGDQWIGNAVAYGCYRKGQAPGQQGPSDKELLEDLQIISRHWQLIRVYGADRDTERILNVIKEHHLPVKVIQGIWLSSEERDAKEKANNITSVLLGIEFANRYPDIVLAVCVGNETQVSWSAHKMPAETLIRYLRVVRRHVTVPVTTADDFQYWNQPESRLVAGEIDFVFTHIHPLWNGQLLENAIVWFDQIYRSLREAHPDRVLVIGETGWATDYDRSKTGPGEQGTLVKGEVSNQAQTSFLIGLDQWIRANRVTTFLFEAFDEPWKGGGEESDPSEIEKNWGVFKEDRTPKESFRKFLELRH